MKDRKITYPLYAFINNKPVILKLHKKLYYCNDCQSSTIEQPIDINLYSQKSKSYINMMIIDLREQTTYSIISRRYRVSISNVIVQFDKYRNNNREKDYGNITSIAVDEVRFIPKVGNYQFIIMNHDNGNIVDILSNRCGNTVKKYIES